MCGQDSGDSALASPGEVWMCSLHTIWILPCDMKTKEDKKRVKQNKYTHLNFFFHPIDVIILYLCEKVGDSSGSVG